MPPATPPASALVRYRVLAPTAAVRVSLPCLDGALLDEACGSFIDTQTRKNPFQILDAFIDVSRNCIGASSNYQDEQGEIIIGEWITKRQNRCQMVITTKLMSGYRSD